jgi:signal peptidase I
MSDEEEIFHPTETEKFSIWKFFSELIKTIFIVVVLVYVTRGFIMQPFIVEGASMLPRLHTSDYLLVDKLSYRFKAPERGEIVVFKYPYDTSVNYVKRVIGLPGETVRIQEGQVSIINKDHPQGFALNEPYINEHAKTLLPSGSTSEDFPVPADSYFVMGDNRPQSSDSREWKYLPKKDMIGRVFIQAYPLDKLSLVSHANY